MNRPLLFTVSLFTSTCLLAQGTAVDFTLDDCAGTSHHLFSELDQGKIVILEFAMVPSCSPCILAGNAIQNVVNNFEGSHPGVVKWYTWGGYDAYTCAQMESWEVTHSFTPAATFIDGAAMANNYGGFSMPTIVVLAGTDHEVILEQHGYIGATQNNITNAIDAELAANAVADLPIPAPGVSAMPNPAQDVLHVALELPIASLVNIILYDASGRVVRTLPTQALAPGSHSLPVEVDQLVNGRYVLQVTTSSGAVKLPVQVMH